MDFLIEIVFPGPTINYQVYLLGKQTIFEFKNTNILKSIRTCVDILNDCLKNRNCDCTVDVRVNGLMSIAICYLFFLNEL